MRPAIPDGVVRRMSTFRDRISIATWIIGLILAAQPVLIAPAWRVSWTFLGSPVGVRVDRDFLVGLFLLMAVVGGTQWILTAWDVPYRAIPFSLGAWTLPLAEGWLALRLLPHQSTKTGWLVGLLGTLVILAFSWHILARLIGGVDAEFPVAFALRVVVYVVAGMLYLGLYALGERSLLAATQMLVGTYLLSVAFWLPLSWATHRRWLYGLVLGVVVAQMAWAFRQLPLSSPRRGLLLLLIFYILTALVERHVRRGVSWRIALEYLITGAIVGGIIFLAVP